MNIVKSIDIFSSIILKTSRLQCVSRRNKYFIIQAYKNTLFNPVDIWIHIEIEGQDTKVRFYRHSLGTFISKELALIKSPLFIFMQIAESMVNYDRSKLIVF